MDLLLFLVGSLGLGLTTVDVLATTTGSGSTSGSGPVSARFLDRMWRVGLAVHGRRPSHRMLHVYGVGLTILLVTSWILGFWLSWTAVFASSEGSVLDATTRTPTDLGGKAYFVGYTLLTLGNGELIPSTAPWRMATLAASGTGLGLVTLSVTFVLNVVQAGNRRRSLAATIWTLGDSAEAIVARAHDDPRQVGHQLWSLVEPFTMVREQHVSFPVLHYHHAIEDHRALPVQAANLDEAIRMLRGDRPSELPAATLDALERALDEYTRAVPRYGSTTGVSRRDVADAAEGAGWTA